ncbi:unnamed protein product [Heligmosomoides polygyrus]|uniref:Retrotrans_gag domain-containing protein n=1 Tax=Heligmosomoides polygyrus TaxID=6339 RepID=A0A183FMB1_HELPZ|nr:unnamed protein product [Heligmosomoides polygyrus]
MADHDAMQDELELEFRRLCGGESERHDILQECDRLERSIKGTQTSIMAEETTQRQQAELQEFRRRCREQNEELRRLRQKPVEAPSPAEGGVKTGATSEWIRQLCRREGIDLMQRQAEFTTAWTCEEEGRWSDAELCALFRSKLSGKARNQYDALPRREREGVFALLVEAMKLESRTETRNEKLVALGELKRLKKQEGQTVSDFCVNLEWLTLARILS